MKERSFVVLFIILNLIIPIFYPDMFPFSAMPMFSTAERKINKIKIFNEKKQMLNGMQLGIYSYNLANNDAQFGCKLPENIWSPNSILTKERIEKQLSKHACKFRDRINKLTVEQYIYEDISGGIVGVTKSNKTSFSLDNICKNVKS